MALALAERAEIEVQVAHDERTAAFMALGVGVATGRPAAVLCTSGTAATHFHAAVVEAHLSGVPMLVLTADRPPELHGIGAAQTIDQQRLFGSVGRFVDVGVAQWSERDGWRAVAAGVWPQGGPVHVNLPFREPLVGSVIDVPPALVPAVERPGATIDTVDVAALAAVLDQQRGVIVAGRGIDSPEAVAAFADSVGWPVLADPRSACRGFGVSVGAFDSLLRDSEFAAAHVPTVVLHLGEPPASKVLGQWLAASGARHVQVLPREAVIDPLQMMEHTVVAPIGAVCASLSSAMRGASGTPWAARWRHAETRAQRAIESVVEGTLTEPAVARMLTARAGALVVSSSMPIRDVEWFGHPMQQAVVVANRGANGIDGVVATAIGVALGRHDRTATVLIGDIALCHDASSLTALRQRDVSVRIVVLDNDGGGIFSFLPQASTLDGERFEQLFGTPHGTDLVALAQAHGLAASTVSTADELQAALDPVGSRVVRVVSGRPSHVAVHARLHEAVAAALRN